LNDHSVLRNDPAIQTAVDRIDTLASSPTLCRMENRANRKMIFDSNALMIEKFIESFSKPQKNYFRLHQVLLGNCCPDSFQKLFERAAVRAKVKIRPGRLYSRDKVGKPKRHYVFRRVC
jgi:hypothetical protein